MACETGTVEIAKLLVEAGADVNMSDAVCDCSTVWPVFY